MNADQNNNSQLPSSDSPLTAQMTFTQMPSLRPRWKKRAATGLLVACMGAAAPTLAHGQFLSVFDSIFSSIQDDMGASLKAINQISQQVQNLYQTTVWPVAEINQARGFVSSSINNFRTAMKRAFNTPVTSAVSPGPQQFEAILHSLYAQIPALQTSFTANYGAVPQANTASPQDRVLMDMDDALGQEKPQDDACFRSSVRSDPPNGRADGEPSRGEHARLESVPDRSGAGRQPSLPSLHAEDARCGVATRSGSCRTPKCLGETQEHSGRQRQRSHQRRTHGPRGGYCAAREEHHEIAPAADSVQQHQS